MRVFVGLLRREGFVIAAKGVATGSDPLWFKDVLIFERNVRAFQDLTGDDAGDFEGLRRPPTRTSADRAGARWSH